MAARGVAGAFGAGVGAQMMMRRKQVESEGADPSVLLNLKASVGQIKSAIGTLSGALDSAVNTIEDLYPADYPPFALAPSVRGLPDWIKAGCGSAEYYWPEKGYVGTVLCALLKCDLTPLTSCPVCDVACHMTSLYFTISQCHVPW